MSHPLPLRERVGGRGQCQTPSAPSPSPLPQGEGEKLGFGPGLTDAELRAIWRACPDDDYGRIVRLLMLTGQRRD